MTEHQLPKLMLSVSILFFSHLKKAKYNHVI